MDGRVVTAVRKAAEVSADGQYRYDLTRCWGDVMGQMLTFVMLNPSTADADVDDPTIRRCIGFARREGLGGIRVVNLYALRATKPSALWEHPDPVGPDSEWQIGSALHNAKANGTPVVCAWGANARADRVNAFIDLAGQAAASLYCLGVTKAGAPRHPLYVRGDKPLEVWPL